MPEVKTHIAEVGTVFLPVAYQDRALDFYVGTLGFEVEAIATEGSSRGGLISLDVTVRDPVPAQFCMRDIDGNRILVVQPSPG